MVRVTDALGREHAFEQPPRRIVSLVPSLTELLFELGLDAEIVGVTNFCVHPEHAKRTRTTVGGTKTPLLRRIQELAPDLVVANREENRRNHVERLEAAGVRVFVTHARSVPEARDEILALGHVTAREAEAERIAASVEAALERVGAARRREPVRCVALIWKRPYMALGGDCFAHDLLARCGAENPFAGAARRYPIVDEAALEQADPEVLLLPTEPYAFGEEERLELLRLDCRAAREGRVHIVEGELLTWYGPRIPRALDTLRELLHPGIPPRRDRGGPRSERIRHARA